MQNLMKAAVYYEFGTADVVRLAEIERPVPTEHQVIIRVRAASINPLDSHMMKGMPWLMRRMMRLADPSTEKPGQIGRDVAGIVDAVGPEVTAFKAGDEVFGVALGACAEYVCASDAKIALKPNTVGFAEAASSPVAGFTALQALRDRAKVKSGAKVLVNGASGGVGTFAVQIAKSFGAEVTAVCSAPNADLVRSIGADHVIDYACVDFTKGDICYDMVFDLVANRPLRAIARVMTPTGVFVGCGMLDSGPSGIVSRLVTAPVRSLFSGQKFVIFSAKSNHADLVALGKLMESGQLRPVIEKRYALNEVGEAMRHLATKRARGKLVVVVE